MDLIVIENKKKNIINRFFEDKIDTISVVMIAIVLLVAYAVFYYMDYSDTLDNSVLLAKSIFNGNFSNYYRYAAENASEATVFSANYNVFLYGIFMIWNIPIIILHKITGFNYMYSTAALLWCKSLILCSTVATSYVLKRIIATYTGNKKIQKLGQCLFIVGSCTVIPALVVCQYDILSLFFMMLGIYFFLKDRRKLFFISFMLAIPLKSFAIFVFIPLILIKEKRIPHIIINIVGGLLIQLLCKLPFLGDEWYGICINSQNRDAIDLIIKSSIVIGDEKANILVNLFLIGFVGACVFAYKIKSNEDNYKYKVIYTVSFVMAIFCTSVLIRAYWIILVVPFLIMIALFNRKYFRINVLLYIIGTACYSVYSLMSHWMFSTKDIVTKLALQHLDTGIQKYGSIQGLFNYYDLTKYSTLLFSVFVAAVIALFVINLPRSKNLEIKEYLYEKWFLFMQIAATAGIIFIIIYANLAQAGKKVYTVENYSKAYIEANIFDENVVKQTFSVEENKKVSEIKFIVDNKSSARDNRNAIKIILRDKESIILEKNIGVANLVKEKEYILKFKKIELEAGKEYTLEIYPVYVRENEKSNVHFEATNEIVYTDYPMYINDVPTNSNLVFELR